MYKKFIKRILDLLLAIILLVLLSPIFIIVSIAIKLETKGPVIFKQIRSGKHNKEFTLYKFRSMTANNDFYNTKEEDQITKVGRVLRKTSLDELPQLFNILKGEMSFIGPRPWITDYAKYFTKHQMRRLEVLPGITGLAQCSGRNNLNIKDRINIDVKYVDHISLKMDLYIFFKTIKSVIKREGFSNSKSAIHEELRILERQHIQKKKNREFIKKISYKKKNKTTSEYIAEDNYNKSSNSSIVEGILIGSGA